MITVPPTWCKSGMSDIQPKIHVDIALADHEKHGVAFWSLMAAVLLLAMTAASVAASRWKLERKFRTWKVKRAVMATQRTAPQMSRVITSIFC